MQYVIAVFNSRSATLNFSNLLKQNNIPCAIINTPHGIQRVCGISVKFLSDFFNKVKAIVSNCERLRNFDGFYFVENGNQQCKKILL